MAKFSTATLFSKHFKIKPVELANRNVFDPVLNVDTKLFIDPLLLEGSASSPFGKNAHNLFRKHFAKVIKLITGSTSPGDAPWRNAVKSLQFPEVRYTCLGYGGASIRGSGGGKAQTATLAKTAKEIINLGVTDPDLFIAMALIEDGIGADRISDMTTKIIMPAIIEFTEEICRDLNVPVHQQQFQLSNGDSYSGELPCNAFEQGPVLLVPRDILRDLPIANDWSEVGDAAARNAGVRNSINKQIASIWAARSRQSKTSVRQWALTDRTTFSELLAALHSVPRSGYDFDADPAGEVFWARLIGTLPEGSLPKYAKQAWTGKTVSEVINSIIDTYKHLIEDRRLSEELYHQNKPRAEKAAQRLFFVVAHAFCRANNLDITPEADTGNGPVDFKFSAGFSSRVLVEIKLSTNGKLVAGYTKQLETYATAEEAANAFYVIVDVGRIGQKLKQLEAAIKRFKQDKGFVRPYKVIDAKRRRSASKL